jgi:hypothetical protein
VRLEDGDLELPRHLWPAQDGVDLGEDRLRRKQSESAVEPGLVDPTREALGPGDRASQEDLRVKDDAERGQRAGPRR